MKADITTLEAKTAGSVELADEVFGLEPRADILHRMVRYQLLKRMAGTHHVKDRSLVSGRRAKMYKQKGTGRARHGNKTVPQFRGGGKAFGPVPRSHAIEMPKKVRALALRHALSTKAKAQDLIILDRAELDEPKTKALKAQFAALGLASALIVDGAEVNANFSLAARNIPNIDVLPIQGLNVYDILRRDKLVLTKAALDAISERFK
jgi:large subunit ribosomal protein L4